MDTRQLLRELSEGTGVSGYESKAIDILRNYAADIADEIREDPLGNLLILKKGSGNQPRPKVMLAAHIDEIGLVVTKVESGGFLRFAPMGGVDQRVLPGQEVIVHGRRDLKGVIGAKPPHVQSPGESNEAYKMEDLYIDLGMSTEKANELVAVGDIVTFAREMIDLQNQRLAGKAIDDRSGVAMMMEALRHLQYMDHVCDVYAVATVQEEVGLRGATVGTYGIVPDLGIAIDVGHGDMVGVPKADTIPLGKGPGIGYGPHVHPRIFDKLVEIAKEWNIDYSVEVSNRPGGTDAFAIQVSRAGVPTVLLSLPLRYMHTPVETLDWKDVEAGGRLLALFISQITSDWVEGLRCF
ncbi:MAG: M42 family metallopeptidase [Firmicutes bacterium]|nr:M42 family metallopeptidase [Bacillota bacterium]